MRVEWSTNRSTRETLSRLMGIREQPREGFSVRGSEGVSRLPGPGYEAVERIPGGVPVIQQDLHPLGGVAERYPGPVAVASRYQISPFLGDMLTRGIGQAVSQKVR